MVVLFCFISFPCLCLHALYTATRNRRQDQYSGHFCSVFSFLPLVTMDLPRCPAFMPGAERPLPGTTYQGLFGVGVPNAPSGPLALRVLPLEWSRACLPGSGPSDNLASCVEWVLVNITSAFAIGPAEDSSPTPDPEASQLQQNSTARSLCPLTRLTR